MAIQNFKQFTEAAKNGNVVTLAEELPSDLLTPLSVLLRFPKEDYSFLFESLEGGEKWGRYCFLGFNPRWVLSSKNKELKFVPRKDLSHEKFSGQGDIFVLLQKLLGQIHLVPDSRLPKLCGGAVGFVSYDQVRFLEEIGDLKRPVSPFADSCFGLYDRMVIFDHLRHKIFLVVNVFLDDEKSLKQSYQKALIQLKKLRATVESPLKLSKNKAKRVKNLKWKTQMEEKPFTQAVLKAKEYIKAGDIFQIQVSRQWKLKAKIDPVSLYRSLRTLNPSPYLFYLKMKEDYLIGSSPEVMVRLEDRKAIIRPIAGTRRRGRDAQDDLVMEKDLINDPKERAEHIMLVDLGRNDLGRVCNAGTVKVTDLMRVERYSHVMHLVSDVEGELSKDKNVFDLIKASFPAGTLTGAPKIRAMEIIEELEPVQRGPYGGCVGYIDFMGNSDLAITIRTVAIHKDEIYVQSAGGVVYDSKPELELKETENKSRAVKLAVENVLKKL